jgi:hypothetical protein
LFARVLEGLEALLNLLVEPVEAGVYGSAEDIVLALEVKINGAIRNPGTGGDGTDRRVEVSVFGDHLDSGVEDALVLFAGCGGTGYGLRFEYCALQTNLVPRKVPVSTL